MSATPRDGRLETELRRGVVQLVALTFLETPRYGYDLIRRLGDAGFEIEEGTLYPILRRLEKQGMLTSEWVTETSRPRKYYRLSEAGLAYRSELIEAWRKVRDATDGAVEGSP